MNNLAGGQFEEAEESFRSQIKILEDEVARLKVRAAPFQMYTILIDFAL